MALHVTKRDGTVAPFQRDQVRRAIARATYEVRHGSPNPHRHAPEARFGLDAQDWEETAALAARVEQALAATHGTDGCPGVEEVQDTVELALLEAGRIDVVRRYIAYRTEHAALRPIRHGENGLQDYIAVSRYCRVDPVRGRRETWSEAVDRVEAMHRRRFQDRLARSVEEALAELVRSGAVDSTAARDAGRFGSLGEEVAAAFDLVRTKQVLPSMRSLQFGGAAIEAHEARMFNCTASPANRPEFFRGFTYLLLAGCGVGFSVQRHHVAELPPLAPRPEDEAELPVVHHVVADTIEGWAEAVDALVRSHLEGFKAEFAFHQVRPRGAPLHTSGNTAPGHLPLKRALAAADAVLAGAAGRRLRPIEVYDVCMHLAQCVLAGGIRRSATLVLFSPEDEEMLAAKTGDWFRTHRHRAASNNSALLVRGEVSRERFQRLFEAQKEFGEPGFLFASSREHLTNPCAEIGLQPQLTVFPADVERLRAAGYEGRLEPGQVLTGFQFCNLTTISGVAATGPERFFALARAAALIGTLQADYTRVPFLGPVTRLLNEREALLGVSICGVLDNPRVLLDPAILRRGAAVVRAVNAAVARVLGINPAARTTCVKPEGTSSLVLNAGSGIHPHHARRYFRRVQAGTGDRLYQAFKAANPHLCEPSQWARGTDVITFPVEAPPQALLRDDVSALQLLGYVRLVQEHWVLAGRASTAFSAAQHNVSNTITVRPEEWDAVADFIWERQDYFTGVALLPAAADKDYAQAPREEVRTPDDVRRWNTLVYRPVDYTQAGPEAPDAGAEARGPAAACAGGRCELG